ncbi:MAG TPA: sigma-70 family RNA polymerase sigma factor [Blastocatellia bacterium]|nr:sigma-70 family RNA polymerase sigma factor [Blastocatellia bacterium]
MTQEAFAKFLACLDPDPARAGEKYESLREALVKFLDWRGASFPEELVDETFNRVARKLDEGEAIRDVPVYCHGVARLVFLQSLERPDNKRVELDELPPMAAPEPEPDVTDVRRECLERCLRQLPAESRELITEYYRNERRQKIDNRVSLAERLGIPLNALRSRTQRIRDKLEKCILRCCKDRDFRPT